MRNSYKFFNALFLGCTLVLGACSKDEEITPVVETPEGMPTIQITEPFANATVKGTIAIKVAVKLASANSTLDKVVVSIDDVVLKESKESAITLDWDSKTATNGTHAIRVVATTVSGKKAETSIGVKVDNVDVLVDFDLPFDYLFWNGTEVWFFASDEKGALIDVIKVTPNAHNILARRNGFKGDTFTLTGVYYKSSFGVTFCTLADFKAGAYTLPSWDDLPSRSSIGEAAITFTDHVEGVNTYHYASGSSSMNIENVLGGQMHKGSLYSNPASYLYSHRVADGIEYITGDIAPGDNLTRSVSAMKLMDKHEITFAKGLTGEIHANGNRDDGYYYAYYSEPVTVLPGTRKKTMYYPGSFFNSYNIQLRAETSDGGFVYNHYLTNTKNLPTEMSYLDCSTDGYAITGNTYKVGIQGTCDYVYSRSYQAMGGDKFVNWQVWTAPNAELVIPKIPDVIRNTYSDLREFGDLSVRAEIIMADYDEVNGYADYVKAPRGFMDFVVDTGWANWRSTTWNDR